MQVPCVGGKKALALSEMRLKIHSSLWCFLLANLGGLQVDLQVFVNAS